MGMILRWLLNWYGGYLARKEESEIAELIRKNKAKAKELVNED